MSLRIIAIGKKHEAWIADGIERYQKRLRPPFASSWILLPHSHKKGTAGAQEESERIKSRLKDGDFVIVLDERGTQLSSPALADMFMQQTAAGSEIVLVIGGAYGVSEELRRSADYVWSLSSLVFPHQLVRLIVVEQLYRAQTITNGEP
jgi:23S rRNA (pseudouridine1915-N3)-methyltransferase